MAGHERARFCLVDDPWIGVRDRSGRRLELGVRETLGRAHDLAGITGDIPTQVFAITRLLLAVLHSALDGPADADAWAELWKAERLPADQVGAYLDEHRDRFDLFHPERPFFQVADLRTAKGEMTELSKLIADVPNGKPFFTTRFGKQLDLTFAEAARWLVHCQAFDPSGIKTGCVGDDRVKGGRGYPIGVAWSGQLGGMIAEGATLKETLLLNLLAQTTGPFIGANPADRPAWEREPGASAPRADPEPTGPLDLYTWQSRRVRLEPVDGRVRRVIIGNGDPILPQNRHDTEPHTRWRRSQAQEKKLGQDTVYMPLEHDPEKAIWRGLASMLAHDSTSQGRDASVRLSPAVLEWHAQLVSERILPRGHTVRVRAVGMIYGSQSSVITEVLDDALSLKAELLGPTGDLVGVATSCVEAAEAAARALANLAADLAVAAGGVPDGPRMRAEESAYADLDRPFRRWVAGLGPTSVSAEVKVAWHTEVRSIIHRLADDLLRRAPLEAWSGRPDRRGRLLTSSHADERFRRNLFAALPMAETATSVPS